jgi:hypothetical protein
VRPAGAAVSVSSRTTGAALDIVRLVVDLKSNHGAAAFAAGGPRCAHRHELRSVRKDAHRVFRARARRDPAKDAANFARKSPVSAQE